MIDRVAIQKYKTRLTMVATDIKRQNDVHYIGSDATRLKILCLLKENPELCVSDIAAILDISVSAVSHQMGIMESHGFLSKTKSGQTVCYTLAEAYKTVKEFFKDTHL
ncbi:MAG TPA: metalloregulator ArsR/SmtB family transcription factor [Patescibacteria group bacterium]|nr:metalloregulator ArsR/SmtB family transcription factor [Patescibacteria group bacterium]